MKLPLPANETPAATLLPDLLKEDIKQLKSRHLYRSLRRIDSAQGPRVSVGRQTFLNFSSNNTLGLANHPFLAKGAQKALLTFGTGSGGSRLLSGNLSIHEELERKIAHFKREEAGIIYSSGYLANIATLTALVGKGDLIIVDRLNHASILDAARQSGAKLWVYPHKDVFALEQLLKRAAAYKRKLVVTDSYFSMDGDLAPLADILSVVRKYQAMLMIDEAHATGVFGSCGRGASEHFNLSGEIDIVMGTFSKALGSAGGFVVGKNSLREYLINKARGFIYTTAPAPSSSGASLSAIELIEKDSGFRESLWKNAEYLRGQFKALGFDMSDSQGPIIPILIGDTRRALKIAEKLYEEKILAPAIRPPSVPKGTDRLRLSVIASHTKRDLERLVFVLRKYRDWIRK